MRLLPRNTFWRQSFYSICKVSTFGKSSSACRAVFQPCVTRWRMTFHGHAISHFLSASTTVWCWQEVSNLANQRVYQILVYRHELFKINFTGNPSSSSSVSPRFFPALSLALFFTCALLSERRNRLIQMRQHYLHSTWAACNVVRESDFHSFHIRISLMSKNRSL